MASQYNKEQRWNTRQEGGRVVTHDGGVEDADDEDDDAGQIRIEAGHCKQTFSSGFWEHWERSSIFIFPASARIINFILMRMATLATQ